MPYTVNLMNCKGITESSKRQAEGAFCNAMEHALGAGAAEVHIAQRGYTEVVKRHGGMPLPLDAPAIDREIVERWEDAYSAGAAAAFVGWGRSPEGPHFEVTT